MEKYESIGDLEMDDGGKRYEEVKKRTLPPMKKKKEEKREKEYDEMHVSTTTRCLVSSKTSLYCGFGNPNFPNVECSFLFL